MPKTKRTHFVSLGPAIDLVPITDFDKISFTPEQWSFLWRICGPSVQLNMRKLELWQVIAAAWMEGALMGYELAQKGKQLELFDA